MNEGNKTEGTKEERGTHTEDPAALICAHPGENTAWHTHVRKLPEDRKRTIYEDLRGQCLVPGTLPTPSDQAKKQNKQTNKTQTYGALDRELQGGK